MSENGGENSTTVIDPGHMDNDPFSATEREISRINEDIIRLKDKITISKLRGEDSSGYENELATKQKELGQSDEYYGIQKHLEATNDINSRPDFLTENVAYEDMTLDNLTKKWAEADYHRDAIIRDETLDEILRRVVDGQGDLTDDQKQRMIDRIQKKMEDYRSKLVSAEQPIAAEVGPSALPLQSNDDFEDLNGPDKEETKEVDFMSDPVATAPVPSIETPPAEAIPTEGAVDDKNKPLIYSHIDVRESIDRQAGFDAERHLREEVAKGGKVKQWIAKSIFGKGGDLFKSTTLAIYKDRFKKSTQEEYELFNAGKLFGDRAKNMKALIEQWKEDSAEAVDESRGEHREIQKEDSPITKEAKDLVDRFCKGDITKDELVAERYRMFERYRKEQGNEFFGSKNAGEVDNLVEVAEAAALRYEHGESLVNVLEGFEVRTGKANTSLDTEVKYNALEKAENWLSGKKLGTLVPSTALVAGVTLVASIGRVGSQRIISTATRFMVFAGGAAAFTGMRKSRELKEERASAARDDSENMEGGAGDKKREALEKFRYECVIPAKEATEQIKDLINPEKIANGGPNAVMDALTMLAATEARIKESASRKIDLLSFSGGQDVRIQERTELARARSEAKAVINKNLTPEVRASLGISAEALFSDILSEKTELFTSETIDIDVNEKDKAFNKYKAGQVAKAVTTTLLVGAAVGVAFQEIKSIFDPNMTGVTERILGNNDRPINGEQHYTLLGGIGAKEAINNYNGKIITESLGGKGQASIPEGYHIDSSVKGHIDLLDNKGNGFKDLPLDSDGKLSSVAVETLEKAGMKVDQSNSFIEDTINRHTDNVKVGDYISKHPEAFKDIHRVDWENNKTNIFDKNELRTYWAGHGGTGFTEQGSVQLDVSHMRSDGSYNSFGSVDAPAEIKNGNLYAVISASRSTQGHGIIVPIDESGHINIPKDSPAFGLFDNVNGRADFKGGFIEIVAKTGETGNGGIAGHILGTTVGKNNIEMLPIDVVDHIKTSIPIIDIIPGPTKEGMFFEMPPVIDLRGKEYMKPAIEKESVTESPVGYGYESQPSRRTLDRWTSERSPKLNENPNAVLNTGEELDRYETEQQSRRGNGYIQEIEGRISANDTLKNINNDTKLVVVMPVAAVQESENIYNALSLYSQQDEASKKSSVILINVNWKEGATDKIEDKLKIEKTISEIERAKRDFPELNIASFEKVWGKEWLETRKDSNGDTAMYGEVIKTLYDTAALAVKRSMDSGAVDRSHDVLLVTNDADALGMHSSYLRHYIEAEVNNKEADAFVGSIRWGAENIKKYPGYHVSQLYMQVMNMLTTRTNTNYAVATSTIGPNAAFRLSSYAAVGGCEDYPSMGVGADSQLGRKILAARGVLEPASQAEGLGYGPSINIASGEKTSSNVNKPSRIRQVTGADIDSSGERLLTKAYLKGKPLPEAWQDFNAGTARNGYGDVKSVDSQVNDGDWADRGEDLVSDFDSVRNRVEQQVNYFTNSWYHSNRSLASLGLSLLFPNIRTSTGIDESWQLENAVDANGNNILKFKFTDSGSKRLQADLSKRQNRAAITKKGFVWPLRKK